MKVFCSFRSVLLLGLLGILLSGSGCTGLKEGESDVPDRLKNGLQGRGKLGSDPSGMFEPR